GHAWGVGVAKLKIRIACDDTLEEKLRGRIGEYFSNALNYILGRTFQRKQSMDMLALSAQRFPARRQNVDLRRLLDNVFDQDSYGFDDSLTAIEDNQHSLVLQQGRKARDGIIRLDQQSK